MIKYSINPSKDAKAINNASPTSPIEQSGDSEQAKGAYDLDSGEQDDN